MNNPSPFLFPETDQTALKKNALVIDIREPWEREGACEAILAMPNVPHSEWHTLPERFPQRPLVLCCAGGVRTRMCVDMLNYPENVYAWTGSIQAWVE